MPPVPFRRIRTFFVVWRTCILFLQSWCQYMHCSFEAVLSVAVVAPSPLAVVGTDSTVLWTVPVTLDACLASVVVLRGCLVHHKPGGLPITGTSRPHETSSP
ncbi:hypothetical protein EDB86DRAFT_2917412 [Lactarius hatsudake]|nr:hypothetical protein EDB86DRAFT_2917412 [Lactarius hatsudake]